MSEKSPASSPTDPGGNAGDISNRALREAIDASPFPTFAMLAGVTGCTVGQLNYLLTRQATPLREDGTVKPHVAALAAVLGKPLAALFPHAGDTVREADLGEDALHAVQEALGRMPDTLKPGLTPDETRPVFTLSIAITNTTLSEAMKGKGPDLEKALGDRGLIPRDVEALEACQVSPFDGTGNLTRTARATAEALGIPASVLFPPDCPVLTRAVKTFTVPLDPARANRCLAPIQTPSVALDPLTDRLAAKARRDREAAKLVDPTEARDRVREADKGLHMDVKRRTRSLPALERGLLVLYHLRCLNVAEIADRLGLEPGIVRARLKTATAAFPSRVYLDALSMALAKDADRYIAALETALNGQETP